MATAPILRGIYFASASVTSTANENFLVSPNLGRDSESKLSRYSCPQVRPVPDT